MPTAQPRPQAEFGPFVDADDVAAGAQRVEDAPLADPLQMLGRAGAAEDRQPAQLVGLVVGRRVGQHVRLVVLDADHAVGAVGDRLRQPEQVGAGVVQRVGAVAVVLEDVVDQSVEPFPAGPRFDGDDGGARRDRARDHRGGRLLDEDRGGRAPAACCTEPGQHVVVADAEQEEHVGRPGADRQAEADVVGVDRARPTPPAGRARAAPRPASPSCASSASSSWPRPDAGTPDHVVRFVLCSRRQCLSDRPTRSRPPRAGSLTWPWTAITDVPLPVNEPVHDYAPGSPERARLAAALERARRRPRSTCRTSSAASTGWATASASTSCSRTATPRVLGTLTNAEHADATAAVEAAIAAKAAWAATPFDERAAVFLRAADLLAGPWREKLAAATMLGQSKTAYQAEIDAPCELIDFWRFNVALRPADPRRSSRSARRACGTAPTTARSRASSTRSPRSTSPPSPATCRPRPR